MVGSALDLRHNVIDCQVAEWEVDPTARAMPSLRWLRFRGHVGVR